MPRDPSLRARSVVASRLLAALVAGGACAAASLAGCGSRGPLDDTALAPADAALEAAAEEAAAQGAPPIAPDAARDDGGIVACGACVLGACGPSILGCLSSAGCRAIFGCVAAQCLEGSGAGGPSPLCLFGCAGSDPASALEVLGVFQCVIQQCGADCGSVLGGLGGGAGEGPRPDGGGSSGGRDGGGGRRDGGRSRGAPGELPAAGDGVEAAAAFERMLSPWPELASAPREGAASGGP